MSLDVVHPGVLMLLPLVLVPLLCSGQTTLTYSSLALIPRDRVSTLLNLVLRLAGAVAIGALVLGLSGLFRPAYEIERLGQGAQIVLLLDRSSSMDRRFAHDRSSPWLQARQSESKSQAARRLLTEFAARRNDDLFGMLVFSTNPIQVLPLTQKQAIIQAAIEAGDISRGLAKTDLGAGLVSAFSFFEGRPYTGSRIVILISDGAAYLDPVTREKIENLMQRTRAALYWIYLRTQNSPGLFADLDAGTARETAPEQLLHAFFNDLELPYRAYSAENPQALEQAISDVSRLQNLPIRYQDLVPRRDLSGLCYAVALCLLVLLSAAKTLEIQAWR